jgi:hypothetical protein
VILFEIRLFVRNKSVVLVTLLCSGVGRTCRPIIHINAQKLHRPLRCLYSNSGGLFHMISNDFNQSIFHIAIIPFISDIYHVLDIITVVSVFWIILW